jgi:transcriptional regulator with XRE-family HTH domain
MASAPSEARAPALEALRVNVIVGRAKARLSQDELATRANVSRPTISRIERAAGDVGIEIVQRIADALNTSVADLFVPVGEDRVDDAELARRAATPKEEFVDARALLEALDEADDAPTREIRRYSRRGRRPLAR